MFDISRNVTNMTRKGCHGNNCILEYNLSKPNPE